MKSKHNEALEKRYREVFRAWEFELDASLSIYSFAMANLNSATAFMYWLTDNPVRDARYREIAETKRAILLEQRGKVK